MDFKKKKGNFFGICFFALGSFAGICNAQLYTGVPLQYVSAQGELYDVKLVQPFVEKILAEHNLSAEDLLVDEKICAQIFSTGTLFWDIVVWYFSILTGVAFCSVYLMAFDDCFFSRNNEDD